MVNCAVPFDKGQKSYCGSESLSFFQTWTSHVLFAVPSNFILNLTGSITINTTLAWAINHLSSSLSLSVVCPEWSHHCELF